MARNRNRLLTGGVILATAALAFLTACEQKITDNPVGEACPGPDAISADGKWILTSPATPGPVELHARGGAKPDRVRVGASGYGTAVDANGTVASFFSRKSDDGVIWQESSGTEVLPKPSGATVSIPTSISDDGRYVGVTSAAVRGGPMSGHVYDVQNGQLIDLPGVEEISQLLLSGSGRMVYTAGTDGVIRRTDRIAGTTNDVVTVSGDNPSPIESTTRAGRYLVYNTEADSTDAELRIWDGKTMTTDVPPAPLDGRVSYDQVDISNNGTRLTATLFDGDGEGRDIISVPRTGGAADTLATVTDGGRAVISANGGVVAYCRPSGAEDNGRDVYAWTS